MQPHMAPTRTTTIAPTGQQQPTVVLCADDGRQEANYINLEPVLATTNTPFHYDPSAQINSYHHMPPLNYYSIDQNMNNTLQNTQTGHFTTADGMQSYHHSVTGEPLIGDMSDDLKNDDHQKQKQSVYNTLWHFPT